MGIVQVFGQDQGSEEDALGVKAHLLFGKEVAVQPACCLFRCSDSLPNFALKRGFVLHPSTQVLVVMDCSDGNAFGVSDNCNTGLIVMPES